MTQAKRTKDKDGEGVESGDPAKTVRDSDRDFSLFAWFRASRIFPRPNGNGPMRSVPEAAIAGFS